MSVCDIYNVVIVMSRTVRGTVQTIFLTPKSVFILRSNMILSEPVNWYIVVCWGGGGGGTVSYVVQRTFHIWLPLLTCSTSYMNLGNYKTQTWFEVCLNDQCRLTLSVQVDRMTVILTVWCTPHNYTDAHTDTDIIGLQVWWHSHTSSHSFIGTEYIRLF